MTDSSKRRAATRATRARQRATGESYNGARQQTAAAVPEPADGGHPFSTYDWVHRIQDWSRVRCGERGCRQPWDAPVHRVGGLVPPFGWNNRRDHMLSARRDGDQVTVSVLDARTAAVVASVSAPAAPAQDLVDEYRQAGLIPGQPGSPIEQSTLVKVGLARPDLAAHRLGYDTVLDFVAWPDGSWRAPCWPVERRHIAKASPLIPGRTGMQDLTVSALDGTVVADMITDPIDPDDTAALNAAFNQLGYTTGGPWTKLPGSRYALVRPGHLAERGWWTLARVRFLREITAGCPGYDAPDRRFTVGEVVTMNQSGRAGDEVDRDVWWSSTDIDYAYIVPADAVEVVEVLQHTEPFWAAAELTVDQAAAVLADVPGAAEAVTGWARAGLVLATFSSGLAIHTPAPERRWIGAVYLRYNRTWTYEAVLDPDRSWMNERLTTLPPDPITAAGLRAPTADRTDHDGGHQD